MSKYKSSTPMPEADAPVTARAWRDGDTAASFAERVFDSMKSIGKPGVAELDLLERSAI